MSSYINYGKLSSSIVALENLDLTTTNITKDKIEAELQEIKKFGLDHDDCLSSLNASGLLESVDGISSNIQGLVNQICQSINTYSSLEDSINYNINSAYKIKKNHTIAVPKGLGNYASREFDLPYNWGKGSRQKDFQKLWEEKGSKHNSKGFCTLDDRYVVASTSTFGTVGDKVDFYMSNGKVIHAVLGDEKSQEYAPWDDNPANMWGHDDGNCIIEFMGNKNIGNSPYGVLGLRGETVVKAVNRGSVLK